MGAADDTVILRRDPADIQREAAERVDQAVRQYRGNDGATIREQARRIRELEHLNRSLEHTLRQVRDERDGMRAELDGLRADHDAPIFTTVDDVADWIRSESIELGARAHIKTGGTSRVVTMRTDTGLLILVVRQARAGLAWIEKTIDRGMTEMAGELVARGRFGVADSDHWDWCVGLVGGGAS